MDDFWQQRYGVAPFSGESDEDGDGLINLIEAISWCDPHDATSALSLVFTVDFDPADGLDDSWQRRHGIYPQPSQPGNLTQAAKLTDPDGDGRSNLEESISGTDPWTADVPGERAPDVGVGGGAGLESFTLTLPRTIAGRRYRLAGSADLVIWNWIADGAFLGDGHARQISLDVSGQSAYFFRFVIDDWDDDGDGLTNWHEIILGTNPDSSDSDQDGLGDAEEVSTGTNPTNTDTDGNGISDGEEGTGDIDGDGVANAADPDNDGDDVNDDDDAHPDDANRSRDLELVNYASINASEGYSDDVKGIALGEGNKLAFWWNGSSGGWGVAVWENGKVNEDKTATFPKTYDDELGTWTLSTPVGIAANGDIAGTATYQPADGGSWPDDLRTAVYTYSIGGPADGEGNPVPSFTHYSKSTECVGITPSGVIWGTEARHKDGSVYFPPPIYGLGRWTCPYTVTFIGDQVFPDEPSVSTEEPDENGNSVPATVTWSGLGSFTPTLVSYSGNAAAGDYAAPDPNDEGGGTVTANAAKPDVLSVPSFKDASRSVWNGSFQPIFAPDPDNASEVTTIDDSALIVGTSTRLTNQTSPAPVGATHLFAGHASGPPDVYEMIAGDVRQQIKVETVLSQSPAGRILLSGKSLEGSGSGQWRDRKILLFSSSDPKVAQLPPSAPAAIQVNGSENIGYVAGGQAKFGFQLQVLVPAKDASGSPSGQLVGTDKLNIATWEKAYKPPLAGSSPELVNDFVETDADRFYIRIANLDPKPVIKISTNGPEDEYDDNATEITMSADPADNGYLISKSQMLVTDAADDIFAGNGAGSDDGSAGGDRTHKAQLSSVVEVECKSGSSSEKISLSVPSLPLKSLTVHAVIVRNSVRLPTGTNENDIPCSVAFVREDILKRVNERFAQAGIRVSIETQVEVVDPPQPILGDSRSVNMENGLALAPEAEWETLVDRTQILASSPNIWIFYVKSFSNRPGWAGATLKGSNTCFVSMALNEPFTTAHEIGHALNLDHVDGEQNLMFGTVAGGIDQVTKTKRLNKQEIKTMRGDQRVR